MKSACFRAELTADGQIVVPPEIAAQIPAGERIQVLLQWGNSDEDAAWREAGQRQFAAAYCDEDSVYDALEFGP
jgi:hypothetical protein